MPVLVHDNKRFLFDCNFEERFLAKEAGFNWDSQKKKWYTTDLSVAASLRDYASGRAKSKIEQAFIIRSPWTKPRSQLPEGLALLPHQQQAISFALGQNRSYLGLDPGLGKTIVAAVVCDELRLPTIYVCPPFLLQNVEAEFNKWAPSLKVQAYSSKQSAYAKEYPCAVYDVIIIPDSMLTKPTTQSTIKTFIFNRPAMLIVDEAHRFKNPDAKRTASLFELADHFTRHIYMSGTPIPNRPIELYPVLSKAAPECINFMSEYQYGKHYCAGWAAPWGWDVSGASNMTELANRVIHPYGKFMLRQKKALLKLPPKLEEVFIVSANMSPRLATMDRNLGEKAYINVDDLIKKQLAEDAGKQEDKLHLATYRRLLGIEKATHVIQYVESIMDETDENILVFGYHIEAISKLVEGLKAYNPLVITGETPPVKDRQKIVDTFQTGTCRILIGNYIACGIGFTLTKATRVIFAEFDWVPGVNEQASDRAHRIGQTSSVLVQYIAYKDSVDKLVLETVLRKRRTFNLKEC